MTDGREVNNLPIDNSDGSDQRERNSFPMPETPPEWIISYNLSEGERPGGIKVRYKLKIISGPRADALDARQAQVIKEVLQWSLANRRR